MFSLFRALTDRLKALFAVSVAQDFEADLLSRDAERRAELLRQADQYDQEGLHSVASTLRQQAESLSLDRPLASIQPALGYWRKTGSTKPLLPTSVKDEPVRLLPLVAKGRKKAR